MSKQHSAKDSDKTHELAVRRVIVIEGLANIVVLLAKCLIGFSTGSLAILSDAVHSLTDVANNIVAWTIVRFSYKPPDRDHPYGHRKFETLAVFFLASLLTLLAFELALQVFRSEKQEISAEPWEIAVMISVLCINLGVAAWEKSKALLLDSDILSADASHTFADSLTTIVVIVGWLLSAKGYLWLDKLCALGVAGLVLYLAFKLFKSAAPILVDEYAIAPENIRSVILPLQGVHAIERIRSRNIGHKAFIDFSILVDPCLSIKEAHDIILLAEQTLTEAYGDADISIRLEPLLLESS